MMRLPKFEYHDPLTLAGACQIMSELGARARPLAGGTDLLVNLKKGALTIDHVVSLGRIQELRHVAHCGDQTEIGACATVVQLAESKEIAAQFKGLQMGAENLGSPLIRNRATLGGNILSARPAADLPLPLMAYGADAVLQNASGERTVSLDDFFVGPGKTLAEPDEILSKILLKQPPPRAGGSYLKLGIRKATEIAIVNVAAFMVLDDSGSTIESARVVLGAVAPVPIRARSTENRLKSERPDENLFFKAAEAAIDDTQPIDDFRATAEYRRAMVAVMTRRALTQAYEEAKARTE
jgi:carbon-monoxide dehydrogenase medium subunit